MIIIGFSFTQRAVNFGNVLFRACNNFFTFEQKSSLFSISLGKPKASAILLYHQLFSRKTSENPRYSNKSCNINFSVYRETDGGLSLNLDIIITPIKNAQT